MSWFPPPVTVWSQDELVPSPPVKVWSEALEDQTLTMLIRSLASTSDSTPHAKSLQYFARRADPDCSLDHCSQPLDLCFETPVNSSQF